MNDSEKIHDLENPINYGETPNLYRWADLGTEILLFFSILWGPWAFGTVHKWSMTVMNVTNYGIGLMLLIKLATRLRLSYRPQRWIPNILFPSDKSQKKQCLYTYIVAGLAIYMLLYVLLSIFNVKATYNTSFNFFEYSEKVIRWMPSTYDEAGTKQYLYNFLGLFCCFFGLRDWLLKKDDVPYPIGHKDNIVIPPKLLRLFWFISINGGLLALIAIIQKLDGTNKLLWFFDRPRLNWSHHSFGPFGYRSNGSSYLNMVIPITFSLFVFSFRKKKFLAVTQRSNTTDKNIVLLPILFLMILGIIVNMSRSGILILVLIMVCFACYIITKRNFFTKKRFFSLTLIFIFLSVVSYLLVWDKLVQEFKTRILFKENLSYETKIKTPNLQESVIYKGVITAGPSKKDIDLFYITDSKLGSHRKAYFKCNLLQNGNLRLVLSDNPKRSKISITYTNILEHITHNNFNLIIERTTRGLKTKLNNKELSGYELGEGKYPPNWAHPVIPNELTVKTKIGSSSEGIKLQGNFFSILPIFKSGVVHNANDEKIELVLNNSWDLNKIRNLMSGRDRIYANSLTMLKDCYLFGCGLGAWSVVYFSYHDIDETWEAWAHCDWLEYFICLGAVGAIPGFILLYLILFVRKSRYGITVPNIADFALKLALVGCLITSIIDFPLNVLSLMHLFVIFSAIRMCEFSDNKASFD